MARLRGHGTDRRGAPYARKARGASRPARHDSGKGTRARDVGRGGRRAAFPPGFGIAVLNSLTAHVAVLDDAGRIVAVNDAWLEFARRNCGRVQDLGVGSDYLEACRAAASDPVASKALLGLEAVLGGKVAAFNMEYGCHSPLEQRWFVMTVTRPPRGIGGAVVAHTDVTDRAQSKEALIQSEQQFHSVLESMSEGLMLFDDQENLIYQNPASLRIHGFGAVEEGLIENKDLPATWNAWDETGRPIEFDEWPISRVFRKERFQGQILRVVRVETGKEFYGSYNGCPILDRHGKLKLGFITIRDITREVRARQALERSERRLRAFFDSEMMGAVYWNVDGRILDANDKFLRMVGYTREDLREGRLNWVSMTPPEHADLDQRAMKQIRESGADVPYEKEFIRKDGCRVPVLVGAALYDEARQNGVAFVLDVSERKRADAVLRQSEERLRLAKAAGGIGIYDYDPQSGTLHWDRRVRELWGLESEDTVSYEVFLAGVHPEDRPLVQKAVSEVLGNRGNGHFSTEYRVVAGGRQRWIAANGSASFEQGRAVRLVGTVQDITDRKEFQSELERLVDERTAKLHELVGELEHFSYSITHDMRAPLRAMRSFADVVMELTAARPDPEVQSFLNRIIQAAERMDTLITDALNYSRAVRQEIPLASVNLEHLLRGMLDTYPQFLMHRDAIHVSGPLPWVMGNEAALTQCFSNLVGNALKFVAPGRSPDVLIRWEMAPNPPSPQLEDRSGQWVRLWVEDKGIGIPKSMLPKLFRMFNRGPGNYEGTGIGLALVRKVVQRMGGRVGVESEPGQGSRFYIDLRAADPQADRV